MASRIPMVTSDQIRKGALVAGGVVTATQVGVASTIVLQDVLRRRRRERDPARRFPILDPRSTDVSDTEITTYTYGEHLYRDMVAAIDDAKETVYLETYIWKSDEWGRRFQDAVNRAAERGVAVYVIYDGFANLVVPASFYRSFHESIRVLRFPTFRPAVFGINLRNSGRDHRKILSVDNRVAFVGGYNIGSLYATTWRDTHIRMTGPGVWELSDAFADFWNQHSKEEEKLPSVGAPSWNPAIRGHRNTPHQVLFPVRGLYLDTINRAQHHIYITQGYFIPDHDILNALVGARGRGVTVKVIIPENSNHVLADWAARGFYTDMLNAGMEIHLYQNAMVHAKTMTVDGIWTTVGSANIDRLSLLGNYEINVSVVDESLAARMEEVFELDLSNSRRLTPEEWDRRGPLARFSEQVMGTLRLAL